LKKTPTDSKKNCTYLIKKLHLKLSQIQPISEVYFLKPSGLSYNYLDPDTGSAIPQVSPVEYRGLSPRTWPYCFHLINQNEITRPKY
jgi:hypothetical protein